MLDVKNQCTNIEELVECCGKYIEIDSKVYQGLKEGKPVVAFETVTALHHGATNYPENAELMLQMSNAAREVGVIPAIIAINQGILKIGLPDAELDQIAKETDKLIKVSRKDIPLVLSNKTMGVTTASGTIEIAALAGIRFVVSGGIGGVHVGAQSTFDISPDLQGIANNNVALICAGSKSIIDLELTLEYLETYGVPVLGYNAKSFPSLCVRDSEYEIENSFSLPKEIAGVINSKWKLKINGGVLVVNPIDKMYSLDKSEMDKQIAIALNEMERLQIKGSGCTTYLLNKINELTGGNSQRAIQKLLVSNSVLASQIALAYSELNS